MAEFINAVRGPFRIDIIQTAAPDQSVQQRSPLSAVIATEEHVEFFFPGKPGPAMPHSIGRNC